MTKRASRGRGGTAVLDMAAILCQFLSGFIAGLVAPVAAIAAMLALIRLWTGKVPYLGHIFEDEGGERHLSFKLIAPEQVKELFEKQKEQYGSDIVKMQAEIKAILEESRAEAQATAAK